MLIIPIQPVPAQTLQVQLAGQQCQINLRQRDVFGVFVDLYVSNILLVGGVLGRNLNRVVRSAYLGFIGDLTFIDNQGSSDPDYTGLGTRFSLAYLEAKDLVRFAP